ncbi:MAG: hypothetical protein FWE20_08260 [Defluviitaleaceae bacterium]|nr:hypothetical protein [Defluviitaleaceae bacterium]
MHLSEHELNIARILKDMGIGKESRDKMLSYFDSDEGRMNDYIKSLSSKGFLSYAEVNRMGQRMTACKITNVDNAKLDSLFA